MFIAGPWRTMQQEQETKSVYRERGEKATIHVTNEKENSSTLNVRWSFTMQRLGNACAKQSGSWKTNSNKRWNDTVRLQTCVRCIRQVGLCEDPNLWKGIAFNSSQNHDRTEASYLSCKLHTTHRAQTHDSNSSIETYHDRTQSHDFIFHFVMSSLEYSDEHCMQARTFSGKRTGWPNLSVRFREENSNPQQRINFW